MLEIEALVGFIFCTFVRLEIVSVKKEISVEKERHYKSKEGSHVMLCSAATEGMFLEVFIRTSTKKISR